MTPTSASTPRQEQSPSVSAVSHSLDVAPAPAEPGASTPIDALAAVWARKYVCSLTTRDEAETLRQDKTLAEATTCEGRAETADQLQHRLTTASAQAWSKTEQLLEGEVQRHGIAAELINPWQIAEDSHHLFRRCLDAYRDRLTPRRLSVLVSGEFGRIRRQYTAKDPRVIGFVSMQFHYTGTMLLEHLSPAERSLFSPFLKVMDDHLYMPLRDAYEAAANHELDSPVLLAVQQLLRLSTRIAYAVCDHVNRAYPDYTSYSGGLTIPAVRTASIRDAEMFQVYVCLCALTGNLRSVQQELFPLCIMLYPRLGVQWNLVQEMLRILSWEMSHRLPAEAVAVFLPYLRALSEMFSLEILYDLK